MAPYWTRLMISITMSLLDHSTSLQYLSDPSFEKKIEFTLPIRNTTNKYVEISDPKLALHCLTIWFFRSGAGPPPRGVSLRIFKNMEAVDCTSRQSTQVQDP
ncbi:hypothetical protein OIY81_3247 [Cryptosporidium canis]|uniref:Uncharacterized protein n=1 Tax=Cryptosporidium canis TaxID=195482 RepID=A0ABQ8P5M7_9CRYT|nr:hypothetical protein OIY81_3247 [Cryptosporidium canis]KAJ1608818.1 hypothetical protein OJ252_2424 [Cryptosporidium canis]